MVTIETIYDELKKEDPSFFITSCYKKGDKFIVFISNGASKMSEELTDNFRAYDVSTGKRVECTMYDL